MSLSPLSDPDPALPVGYDVRVPDWLVEFGSRMPPSLEDYEEAMRWLNECARLNQLANTGGPFAAMVVESDSLRLVSVGVNVVLASQLSIAHAEIVALGLAHHALGAWNLGAEGGPAHTLIVNARPCVMCGGAALWSGVSTIVYGASGEDVERLTGFDEGPVHPNWVAEMERRGVEIVAGVSEEACCEVLREYGARADAVVYNAR